MSAPVRTNTAVATVEPPAQAYPLREDKGVLAPFKSTQARKIIEAKLPKGVTFERIMAEVYFAIQKTPKLATCTAESLIRAVTQCASWDLEIGVKAHLVPFSVKVGNDYEDQAQAVRDYKGDAELVVRCGAARAVDAEAVYANDFLEFEKGSSPVVRHRPILDPSKRGALTAFYAVARLAHGDIKAIVLSREEVDEVRERYSKQWKEHWVSGKKVPYTLEEIPWYGKKTCIHQLVKLLPTSPMLAKLKVEFEEEESAAIETSGRTALPAAAETDVTRLLHNRSTEDRVLDSLDRAPLDEQATEEEAPATAEPRKRYGVEETRCPMGSRVGYPLWMVASADLLEAYNFARTTTRHKEFADAAESVLEMRRNEDIPEPTAEELALPKPPLPKAQG